MKRNDLGDICERSAKGFRTPVNPRKPPVWSPILDATTPDLNGPDSGCKGTPGLVRSLGINPELDVSWSSAMATPTSDRSGWCEAATNNSETIENHDEIPKVLQRRNLFLNEDSGNDNHQGNNKKSSCQAEESRRSPRTSAGFSKDLSCLLDKKKPSSKFIYPEPVYIKINRMAQTCGQNFSLHGQNARPYAKEESVPSPNFVQRISSDSSEVRKTLICSMNQVENVEINDLNPSITQNDKDLTTEVSSLQFEKIHHEHFHPTVNNADTNLTSRKGALNLDLKVPKPESDFIRTKEQNTTTNLIGGGFNTASGRKIIVSEEAVIRAKAILEDINEENYGTSADHEKSVIAETLQEVKLPQKRSLPDNHNPSRISNTKIDSSNYNVSSSTSYQPDGHQSLPIKNVGFNTASGKQVAISEKAMARAKSLFNELEDDPLPSDSTTGIPETAGFSLASGKQIVVSEKAISKAKKLLEEVDLSTESMEPRLPIKSVAGKKEAAPEVKMAYQKRNSNNIASGGNPVSLAGFSTASGKQVVISEEAICRATSLFEAIEDENVLNCVPASIGKNKPSVKLETTSQKPTVSVTENWNRPKCTNATLPEVPVTVGFNTARWRTVKITEKALLRAKKLFEENSTSDASASILESSKPEVKMDRCSPPRIPVSIEQEDSKRKLENVEEDCGDDWVSSPTIGKKKKRNQRSPSQRTKLTLTPMSGTPSLMFENTPTFVKSKVLGIRRKARQDQKLLIELKQKKERKPAPKAGSLYLMKKDSTTTRKTLKEVIGNRSLPEISAPYQLLQDYAMLPSVCLVQASNASTFNFFAWEHFPVEDCQKNSRGFKLGEFLLILSDDNTIGVEEIGASLLASENVDPSLISMDWIRNHYRWIVWKLASMELRIPALFARACLTPSNVLEQLKYRYDREIDHCERSALRRIIEQDDTPAKMMILCVAEIRTSSILEMTDGWYSIDVHCDTALKQLVESNKIFAGVKLAISGAELVSPGPTTPLEKGADTFLRISANSTRRARWDTKLGFYSIPSPFPISLASVLADGGVISHLRVNIIRVYPMIYMEKTADGKAIFRGERQHRRLSESAAMRYERMMEKIVEDIEREEDEQDRKRIRDEGGRRKQEVNLTDEEKRRRIHEEAHKRMQTSLKTMEGVPMLRLRVIDWRGTSPTSAIVSTWRPGEDLLQHLKEGRAYHLYNVNAAGIRVGELQFNATKHTAWNEMKCHATAPQELKRCVVPFSVANEIGFKPIFNELDIVGLVVYVGQKQVKDPFQTCVLSDGTDYFGVKCWTNLEEYALSDVIVVGSFLAFSNLQWRATASRTTSKLPFAFIHENTVVSARPAQKHLENALHSLKESLNDPEAFLSAAEAQLSNLLASNTPQSSTPRYRSENRKGGMFTPTGVLVGDVTKDDTPTSASSVTMARARLLEKYGTPPALSPWNNSASPHVRQRFKPPARKPPAV